MDKHKMRAIIVLGNDCMRPRRIWQLPKPGSQSCDVGYHCGRKMSQHGSFPGEMGYSQVDEPVLKPKFFAMCEGKYDFTKWFHDLFRQSLSPYAPKEISLIKRINAMAGEDRE